MSVRKSRVRPVPDFSRAHQLLESQLEARKREMNKLTKVEEFNLSRPFTRSEGSTATPDISKPSPRNPDFARLHPDPVRSSSVSSSDVNVPKLKECAVSNFEPGLQRKAAGILKNAGKTDEATTGQRQTRFARASLTRRPRVTFDVASPLRESPISMPRRVRVAGSSSTPGRASPKPVASRMLIECNRIPVEQNRTAHSMKHERQQPQRVPVFGSGQRITITQSCSRAACMGGFSRFRADSIAKAIDFTEESEEDGKFVSHDVSKSAPQPVETATAVATTNKRFGGLKRSPVGRIHVDVTENEDASMCSPLLRLNCNSENVVRSPLLRKIERIVRIDAKNRSRLPQPRDVKGRTADKENRAGSIAKKKGKSRDEKELIIRGGGDGPTSNRTDGIECSVSNFEDHHRVEMEATGPSVKADALEQLEEADAFDANQTISKLEKKVQRLRRRSQLTEEKSELDSIMKKLEALEKKIESMRMGFRSVRKANFPSATGDAGGSYGRSISTSDDPQPARNESKVCPTEMFGESQPTDDVRPDAPESEMESHSKEEISETPTVTSELEPDLGQDAPASDALERVVSEVAPESMEGKTAETVYIESAAESMEDLKSDVQCPEFESELKDSDVAVESGLKLFEVPHVFLEADSKSEDDFFRVAPCLSWPTDCSEWKENVDPLSQITGDEGASPDSHIQTGKEDPSVCSAGPCERIVLQDITGEIQSRATQFDEDDGIFVVEESSDDSELMNSEDFTEWSSSPIDLMNQCLTSMASELSSELSAARTPELTPEDVLTERLAKFSISDRLEMSNAEASPNMSSEFAQYNRYGYREGVDGVARLFNPVAAALSDADSDDGHFVPISPAP